MDSNNWRVKRDPAEPSPFRGQNSSSQQRRDVNRSSGGFERGASGGGYGSSTPTRDGFRKPMNSPQSEQRDEQPRRFQVNDSPIPYRNASQADPASAPYRPPKDSDRWRRPEKSEKAKKEQAQRLYVGGLPRFDDQAELDANVRGLFEKFNVTNVSKQFSPPENKKHLPGNRYYAFVDLATTQECEDAIATLDGVDRWNWRIKISPAFTPTPPQTNKPNESYSSGPHGKPAPSKRLFVAGLPEFLDQETTERSMRELFEGFELKSISKLFYPKEPPKEGEGNHCFCFVEVTDFEQADRARLELDWKVMWDGEVRVKTATPSGGGRKSEDRASRDERPSRGWRD